MLLIGDRGCGTEGGRGRLLPPPRGGQSQGTQSSIAKTGNSTNHQMGEIEFIKFLWVLCLIDAFSLIHGRLAGILQKGTMLINSFQSLFLFSGFVSVVCFEGD